MAAGVSGALPAIAAGVCGTGALPLIAAGVCGMEALAISAGVRGTTRAQAGGGAPLPTMAAGV